MPRFTYIESYPVDPNQIAGKERIFSLLIAIVLSLLLCQSAIGQSATDTLDSEPDTTFKMGGKAQIMIRLARENFYTDIQEAVGYARKAHELFIRDKDEEGIAMSLNIMGAGYFSLGDYATAESCFSEALIYAREKGDSLQCGKILNNLAGIKYNTGQLAQAVDYYSRAGRIFKQEDQQDEAIGIAINISSIYRSIGSYQKSHEYLENAKAMVNQETDLHLQGSLYHNLGALLLEEGKYAQALDASLYSYDLRARAGHRSGQIKTLISLGSIFHETGNKEAADTCYRKAGELAGDYGFKEDEAWVLMHLGYLQFEAQDFPKASGYFNQSLVLADELNDTELKIQLHNYLFLSDSARGDFSLAINHLQQYNQIKAGYNTSEAADKLEELEALFLLAKTENQKQENIIKRNKSLITGLLVGLVILALITILIIQQIFLRSQKRIAVLSQENLRSQMNPHFIFNILNSIHAYLLNNDKESSSTYLVKFSNLLRLTLDNSRSKLTTIQEELKALELYLELESMRFNNKLSYEIIVDEEIDPIMFRIPTFLLQPYVENSIIHGLQHKDGKGKIEIRLDYRTKGIHCSITDDGVGRKKAEEIKKKKGIERKSHGSKITETRLQLLNKIYGRRYSVLYTDLYNDQEQCTGTRVEFDLPVLN